MTKSWFKNLDPRSLGGKIFSTLLIFSLVPAGAIVLLMFALDNTTEQVGSLIRDKAVDMVDKIDRNLFERYGDVKAFALNSVLQDHSQWYQKGEDANAIVRTMNAYVDAYDIYLLTLLVDSSGRVVAVNSEGANGEPLDTAWIYDTDYSEASWFKKVLVGDFLESQDGRLTGVFVEDVHRHPDARRVHNDDVLALTFSAPVRGPDGEIIAVWHNVADFSLVENILIESYASLAASLSARNIEFTLLDRSGRILVDYDPFKTGSVDLHRDFEVILALNLAERGVVMAKNAVEGTTGFSTSRHARKQVDQLGGFAHSVGALGFPGLGWSALIRMESDDVVSGVTMVQLPAVAMLVATAVVGIVLALSFASRLLRPLSSIAAIAPRIMTGEQVEWPPYAADDEIGALSNALRQMAIVLSQRAKDADDKTRRLHSILETAAEGIVTIDGGGTIVSFNRAASAVFGYEEAEILNQNISVLMPPEVAKHHDGYLARYLQAGEARVLGLRREVEGRRKGGSHFPMEFAVSEILDSDGGTYFTGIIRDLTEQHALESKLVQAQKLESIGQLAAGIAHEINTPSQYVGDNLEFLDQSFGELGDLLKKYHALQGAAEAGPVSSELVSEVSEAAEATDIEFLMEEIPRALLQSREGIGRVTKIVRAMKDFSHPGSTQKEPIDLNRAIESTVTVANNEWKYVAELETDFDADLPPVPCLAGEVNQVVLNIVVNAAQAMVEVRPEGGNSEKGEIRIRTRREGDDWVALEISDDGPGMPEQVRSKIFDPFFTTKEVGKGTGQGLAIAYSVVVDKHHGTMDVESEVGQGTTFHIRLPLHEPQQSNGLA